MKYYTSSCQKTIDLRLDKDTSDIDAKNIIDVFYEQSSKNYNQTAISYYDNNKIKNITWEKYFNLCQAVANGFIKCGVEKGVGVGILGFNSLPWFVCNMAAIMTGGYSVGIYTTNSTDVCEHILKDSNCKVVIVENSEQLDKIMYIKDKTKVKYIIQYEGKLLKKNSKIYTWDSFVNYSFNCMFKKDCLECFSNQIKPNQCATIIYTPATTGFPKGVMLSHDNILWTTQVVLNAFNLSSDCPEKVVSYLPLPHIAAQLIDIYLPLMTGGTTFFAKPDALKGTLVQTLKEVHPTIFLGIPRVWEKIMDKIKESLQDSKKIKRNISMRATRFSLKKMYDHSKTNNESSSDQSSSQKMIDVDNIGVLNTNGQNKSMKWNLVNNFVFKKVKENMGFKDCKVFLSGTAPISSQLIEFFASFDIRICNIYSMTECSGLLTISTNNCNKIGSCGKLLPHSEIKLDRNTNEIWTRGRHVMMGYINLPEKNKETIDKHGWLHTGDVGRFDDDGYLYIFGRMKDIIVTSEGENIPPVLIEDRIRKEIPEISNCMVIGEGKKYLTCLLTLKCQTDCNGTPTDKLDENVIHSFNNLGIKVKLISECLNNDVVNKYIQKGINNTNLNSISNAQKVKKFKILPQDFSTKGGELGPTLKLKRNVVNEKYKEYIDQLYSD